MTEFLGAGARQFGFMLRALRLVQPKLEALGIPFFLLQGEAGPPGGGWPAVGGWLAAWAGLVVG